MNMTSPGLRTYHSGAPRGLGVLLLLILAFLFSTCSPLSDAFREGTPLSVHAQRWPQAEEAFRHDRRWLGGDGASSVVLDHHRVLWLFGDSFIGDGRSRDRHCATVVRNTVAIQNGLDPACASVAFSWKTRNGEPDAFFPAQGRTWYWPGSGAMVQGRLLVFLMEIAPTQGGLGFAPTGWAAVFISNPEADPGAWRLSMPGVQANPFHVIVGSASCLTEGEYLYAFGADAQSHGACLVRWRIADAAQGDLRNPEWWMGKDGWVAQALCSHPPETLFRDAQMEFTVHHEPALGGYVQVQTGGFADPCLVLRRSRSLTGAWSDKERFSCPEGTKGLLVYAGKAHPGLTGGDLICTMAKNTLDPQRLVDDNSLYYPVFVRGTFRGQGEGAH